MWKSKNIFDCESDEDEGFKINENYAERYDKWRSKEEYEKLKSRAKELESSSDETSDEDGEGKDFGKAHNPNFDKEFLLSIGTIYKHKKGDIEDLEKVKFFSGDYRIEREQKEKPMTVKDLEHQMLMEHGGKFEEDEIGSKDIAIPGPSKRIKFEDGLDDSDDDGDGLLTSGLFKVKDDADEDADKASKNDVAAFIKGAIASVAETEHKDVLETLKGAWNDEKMSKKDKWLVDFFLNERYLAEGSDDEYDNELDLEEEELSDEEPDQKLNPLATQYKFRHQEPGELIKRHPRQVVDSMRPKDQRRKEKREAIKDRKLRKKEEKKQEIEMLKALKYKEIEEKIDKIREVSGNEDIDLGDVDLDEDFNPEAHDAFMDKMLGENYYNNCNVDEELPDFEDESDNEKLFDNWTRSDAANGDFYQEGGDEFEEEYYDEDFNMDADYDPEKASTETEKRPAKSSSRKNRRRRSKFSQALEKEKPLFDPKEKDFSSYYDEYYKLDFEDIVGGIPCRFKYRKVESNNFGLTTGEILTALNKDLNRWVGIKKIMQYNRSKELEDKERQMYTERAKYEHVKLKKLPSLFAENAEELAEKEREKRRLKNLKKKQKKWKLREGIEEDDENPTDSKVEEKTLEQPIVTEGDNQSPKKQKRRHESEESQTTTTILSSEDRIENSENHSTDKQETVIDTVGKKKKKKKKRDHSVDVPSEEIESTSPIKKENLKGNPDDSRKLKKDKRKKKDWHSVSMEGNPIKKKKSKKAASKIVRKEMRDNIKKQKIAPYFEGISDKRLAAYGQNPKKLKNRVLYGTDS